MTRRTLLCLSVALGLVTACRDTTKDVKDVAEEAAEKTKEASDKTGAAIGAATETADVKLALMADSTVDASDINVDTDKDRKTVTLEGTVKDRGQQARAEAIARERAPGYTIVNRLRVR